ncbi:hypothetical protein ACLESO_37105 [Pyxidicoccus sp. 3LG]
MSSKLLAMSAALSLVLALGCGPSQAPETQEPQESQQVQEAAGCPKGQYLCTSCDGSHTFCGDACPDCIPPAAPTDEVEASSVCPYPTKLCLDCQGGIMCARTCPTCPPPTGT